MKGDRIANGDRITALLSPVWRPIAGALGISPTLTGALSLTAFTNVLLLVVNLGSGIIQARGLGPEGRGELTVATLWPALIAGLGSLGIAASVGYYTSRERGRTSRVLATALAIAVPQTLVLGLIGWFSLPLILHGQPPQVLSQTRFFLWYLPLYPLLFCSQSYLQGKLAMGWFNAAALATGVVSTVVLAVLWVSHQLTVHTALVAMLASWAVAGGLAFVGALWKRGISWKPDPALVRPLLWFGLRRQVGNIASLIVQLRLDLILLSFFVSTSALGTYSVAGSAAAVASTIPVALGAVLYPVFARQTDATLPFAMSRFLLAAGVFTVATGPILLVLIPLAVPYVYGPAFLGARPLAALLAVGSLIRGWNNMLIMVISGAGRPFTASIGQAVELIALAPLLAVLVPRLGQTGGGISVPLAAAAAFIYLFVSALRVARLTPRRLGVLWVHQIQSWRSHSISSGR